MARVGDSSRIIGLAMLVLATGCGRSPAPCPEFSPRNSGDPISLESLACFTRFDGPVFRDHIPGENYQVASDAHVFVDEGGVLRMVYTGDFEGRASIKLATGEDWDLWAATETLIAGTEPAQALFKETAFYRLADSGSHQVFFIGYADEETYQSQIFMAEADSLLGPYEIRPDPIVTRGEQDGRDVYLMTSPTVNDHEGTLFMSYLAWNDAPSRVTEVWVMAVTSLDDGQTWSDPREVEVPIGMEGQVTQGPDGRYYAVSVQEVSRGREGIFLGVAEHPLGPYVSLEEPVLVQAGRPYELHEANAPMVIFDEPNRMAYLYYVGANYWRGWWIMAAYTRY